MKKRLAILVLALVIGMGGVASACSNKKAPTHNDGVGDSIVSHDKDKHKCKETEKVGRCADKPITPPTSQPSPVPTPEPTPAPPPEAPQVKAASITVVAPVEQPVFTPFVGK